jgi:hypothetical protein
LVESRLLFDHVGRKTELDVVEESSLLIEPRVRKLQRNAYLDIRGPIVSHTHSDATALQLGGDAKRGRTPVIAPRDRPALCQFVEHLRPLRQVEASDDVFHQPGEEAISITRSTSR